MRVDAGFESSATALSYYFGLGPNGVFWAITVALSVLAIVSALLFKRGKWKEKVIVGN